MSKRYFILLLLLNASLPLSAQLRIGFLGGVHSASVKAEDLLIYNKTTLDSFKIVNEKANYGFQIGGFIGYDFDRMFIQTECMFNSNNAKYKYAELTQNPVFIAANEHYNYLDIPFRVGIKLDVFRASVAPVAHIFINSTSELKSIPGFSQKFKTATWGGQVGIGFDFDPIVIDLNYELNTTKYGDHFRFFEREFKYSKTPARLILNVGFKF